MLVLRSNRISWLINVYQFPRRGIRRDRRLRPRKDMMPNLPPSVSSSIIDTVSLLFFIFCIHEICVFVWSTSKKCRPTINKYHPSTRNRIQIVKPSYSLHLCNNHQQKNNFFYVFCPHRPIIHRRPAPPGIYRENTYSEVSFDLT